MLEKIKEKMSLPAVQMILFALIFLTGIAAIIMTANNDKERNTPDMTDPRAEAVVTSVSSYTAQADDGSSAEYYNVTVDFSIGSESYHNVSVYNVPFRVNINDRLQIKYDAQQPSICSVVSDPEPQYSTLTYIFFTAVSVFSVFGFGLAVRRSKLKDIRENVAKKNAELGEPEDVKEGYGSYDGTAKANVDGAPFTDRIDYNQIYDENQGVMNSFYDPTAPYTGYDGDNHDQPFRQDFYNPEAAVTDYEQPYSQDFYSPSEPYESNENPFYTDSYSSDNNF